MPAGEAGLDIRHRRARDRGKPALVEPRAGGLSWFRIAILRWPTNRGLRRKRDPTSSDRAARRSATAPLKVRGLKHERLRPSLLAEDERQLLRRPQPVRMRRPEGRARLFVLKRAEHLLVEEAVFAARLLRRRAPARHHQ